MANTINKQINPHIMLKNYKSYCQHVCSLSNNNQPIDRGRLYRHIKMTADKFEKMGDNKGFTGVSIHLVNTLVNCKNFSLASIVFSILCKIYEKNPEIYEDLSYQAIRAARNSNDPVHLISRAYGLEKLYSNIEPNSKKHFKILNIMNQGLGDICDNYEINIKERYQTFSRELQPLENYELLLCKIKLKLALYYKNINPKLAIAELKKATQLLDKNKNCSNHKMRFYLIQEISKLEKELNIQNKKQEANLQYMVSDSGIKLTSPKGYYLR